MVDLRVERTADQKAGTTAASLVKHLVEHLAGEWVAMKAAPTVDLKAALKVRPTVGRKADWTESKLAAWWGFAWAGRSADKMVVHWAAT